MAPGSNERHPPPPPSHTGTVPKTKVRNCVVPQEAVTPTRRDLNSANLVSTSLDWVPEPVTEYNSRGNYAHYSRNNNRSDQDFSDLDNSLSLESALQRFVPVRPQPRGLPLPMQSADGLSAEDSLHHYPPSQPTSFANGVSPHANHAAAAIMIVNPTTPNTVTGNPTQPFNVINTNRNNLTRAYHSARNSSEAAPGSTQHAAPHGSQHTAQHTVQHSGPTLGRTKSNNLTSNVYEPATHDTTNGEAMVVVCPDAASVERRLGQIREYIRVTSSLVDTMRNSEDEAYIEHTKEEYDELVEMVMKLKESETKLIKILDGSTPDNNEVLSEEEEASSLLEQERPNSTNPFIQSPDADVETLENANLSPPTVEDPFNSENLLQTDHLDQFNKEMSGTSNNFVKKLTNIENEQINKSNDKLNHLEPSGDTELLSAPPTFNATDTSSCDLDCNQEPLAQSISQVEIEKDENFGDFQITEPQTKPSHADIDKPSIDLNEVLIKNILSCNEKLAVMEALREAKNKEWEQQRAQEGGSAEGAGGGERARRFCRLLDRLAGVEGAPNNMPQPPTNNCHEVSGGVRPMSVQSNGSAYSDNELWQNELKAKMEVSQQRLAALQDQQKRLLKYQAEAKQQLADMHNSQRHRASQEGLQQTQPTAPHHQHQGQVFATQHQQPNRPYHSNQIGVATTLPHTIHASHHYTNGPINVSGGGAADVYHVSNSAEHPDSTAHMLHHPDDRFTINNNTLPHGQLNVSGGGTADVYRVSSSSAEQPDSSAHVSHHSDDRFTLHNILHNTNMLPHVESSADRGSEGEDDGGEEGEEGRAEGEAMLRQHGRELQHKLRDLQRKKQHIENLVENSADRGSDEEEDGDECEERRAGVEGLLNQHGRELQHKLRDLQRKKQHMANLVESSADRGSAGEEDGEEEGVEGRGEGEGLLSQHGRELQHKLRDLQRKKQHMENLVAEFQKLQAAERRVAGAGSGEGAGVGAGRGPTRNTYLSSPDDSADEHQPSSKCNKADANIKNDDPFKLMEITAIKAALQKTQDLMRSVRQYEQPDSSSQHDDGCPGPAHSNINDNRSEGSGSAGGRSVQSIHNSIQPSDKRTNQSAGSQDANIATLQLLAQQLRREAENVSQERQRLKHFKGKFSQKRVNVGSLSGGGAGAGGGAARGSSGPLERQQAALRAELAEKQRQLEMILNKEKELTGPSGVQNMNSDTCSYSAINQSYNSEHEDVDSRADEVMFPAHSHPHSQPDRLLFRSEEGNLYALGEAGVRSATGAPPPPPHALPPAYCSDSDTGSRGKSSQQSAHGRRQPSPPARPHRDGASSAAGTGRGSIAASAPPPPVAPAPPPHTGESSSSTTPYPVPPPLPLARAAQPSHHAWANKSNQDARTNQFTQNSHSQTMERLLGQQLPPFPPSMPFNMMMPYGMVGGVSAACSCSWWGPWCWQQLTAQQTDIQQLRDQLNSLEERWRSETAPHALNNQVAPGNRANNYWDNFRSYSRQNLLSANSKTNADGHLGSVPPHNQHPLVERSHNTLHPATPCVAPPAPVPPLPTNTLKRNVARPHVAVAATTTTTPDVLNVNRHAAPPELPQPHSHNLNTKRKSSSKLPAKNSSNRRNCGLHFIENANINIAGESEIPDPNLASTSRDDKATSKLFDLLRENVYSEVTALISANESHPHFLIQLFRELQQVSSDALRRHALQSIRDLLSRSVADAAPVLHITTDNHPNFARDETSLIYRDIIDFMIARGDEICSPQILDMFRSVIVRSHRESGHPMLYSQKRLQEFLSKFEGLRLRDVSGDIIDNLSSLLAAGADLDEPSRQPSDASDSALQDVAGSLNIFSASDSQLHQLDLNGAYDPWSPHGRADPAGGSAECQEEGDGVEVRNGHDAKVDLIECVEMYNGDLAEADQTCPGEADLPAPGDAAETLPDLVDTDETTPPEAEAEWLGLDRVPTRLQTAASSSAATTGDSPANQKD